MGDGLVGANAEAGPTINATVRDRQGHDQALFRLGSFTCSKQLLCHGEHTCLNVGKCMLDNRLNAGLFRISARLMPDSDNQNDHAWSARLYLVGERGLVISFNHLRHGGRQQCGAKREFDAVTITFVDAECFCVPKVLINAQPIGGGNGNLPAAAVFQL